MMLVSGGSNISSDLNCVDRKIDCVPRASKWNAENAKERDERRMLTQFICKTEPEITGCLSSKKPTCSRGKKRNFCLLLYFIILYTLVCIYANSRGRSV